MNTRFLHILFHWLPLGVALIVLHLFIYGAVQQNYRTSLNDPQIQMVQDARAMLSSGKTPAEIVGRAPLFDIEKTLRPFIAVYDEKGTPLESSAILSGKPPAPPLGVLEASKSKGENRVTWQPNDATRIALVVTSVDKGKFYIAAGRIMKETEARIDSLTDMLAFSLIGTLFVTFALNVWGDFWRRRVAQVSIK